jgi:surface protein with Ig-like domain/HYR domain-containing protein
VLIDIVDTTAPVISLVGANPLTVECHTTFSDPGATATDGCTGSVSVTPSGSVDVNVPGTYTITYSATDGVNSTTATRTVNVVDTTGPDINCPANIVVTLPPNSMATSTVVNYPAVTATDSCSSSVTVNSSPASGSVFPVGTTTVNATASDGSNSSSCSFTVTVLYNFTGFFPPVSNLPTFNVVNAGRAIPVKFSLSGYKGLNIFAPNSPGSGQIVCNSSDPAVILQDTVTAGGSSLNYDASADQYVYVWKTDASWAGTCRQLVVQLSDGSLHRADFKFK